CRAATPARHSTSLHDALPIYETNAGDAIAERFTEIMKAIGMPNGLTGVGITGDDLDALVEGTLPQQRLLVISPKEPSKDDFRQRSEEHTSELQSRENLVCRLL